MFFLIRWYRLLQEQAELDRAKDQGLDILPLHGQKRLVDEDTRRRITDALIAGRAA